MMMERRRGARQMMTKMIRGGGGSGGTEYGSNGEEEVELLVTDLEEVLRVDLDEGVAGAVKDAFDETIILGEDFEGEVTEPEDACMVAAGREESERGERGTIGKISDRGGRKEGERPKAVEREKRGDYMSGRD
ncbi:hypothetical protein Scep_020526 [Stephania cephalantha]|uniref:Uncharacterized protein n=1 Tax=Stephania cephalantha TaxID=152367 RepID=A0AAP0ID32_9MAGN